MITSAQSVSAVHAVNPSLVRAASGGDRFGDSFPTILQSTSQAHRHETAREAATQLVSSAFIMPVLESLRTSPFDESPFAPGFAERRFAPLLDQQIADRIVEASNFSLVDMIARRFASPMAPQGNTTSRLTQESLHGPRYR